MPLFGIFPKPGDIYMCDFSGYVAPEIVKMRRVVVISPVSRGQQLALVVPISTTPPRIILPIHVRLPGEAVYPCFDGAPEVWVKADLLAHVRFDRLNRVRVPRRDAFGNPIPRKHVYIPTVTLDAAHLAEVRKAVLHSLGLGRLAPHV